MKPTAAQRVCKALGLLQKRIYKHCNIYSNKPLEIGLCTVAPKYASINLPSRTIEKQIEQRAIEYFKPLNKIGVYIHGFVPPLIPLPPKDFDSKLETIDNYNLKFEEPYDNEFLLMETLAMALIYCPAEEDMGGWNEWYLPQIEAMRLTPMLYDGLLETTAEGRILNRLKQPGAEFFCEFMQRHALNDYHLIEGDRKKEWQLLYPQLIGLFSDQSTLYEIYKEARKKKQTRNIKINELLSAFIKDIECEMIEKSKLSENRKKALLHFLRKGTQDLPRPKYKAKRPAICMSYLECANFLYSLLKKIDSNPIKYQTLIETALFVWICQHAAFSKIHVSVDEVLNIKVTDINFIDLVINIGKKEINIIGGLAELLKAFIGEDRRKNKRKLFPSLDYSILEKTIEKYSKSIFRLENSLTPRDFIGKTHTILGARISKENRELINQQERIAMQSPYLINPFEIKKRILEKFQNNAT